MIARSDQGRLPIKREPVRLDELLERVRGRFAARAEAEGRCDRGRGAGGRRGGARSAADGAGARQPRGQRPAPRRAGPCGSPRSRNGERAELSVADEGPGFPEAFAPRAFERFTRADEGRTGGGAGLGLAIVRAVARAHGGDASADGPRVRISVPAS